MRLNRTIALIAAGIMFCGVRTFGGAIDVPQMGARAAGQADAFSAQADDASAIFYNPAGLTQLTGTVITGGVTVFSPDWEFDSATGQQKNMRLPSVLPDIYIVSDFGLENWRFGLGIDNPFGLNEDWGHHGPVTPLVTEAHLFTYNLAPSVAYQINDNLSVGVDLNVYWGDVELNRSVFIASGLPMGHFHFRGQDAAIGATPGVMWKINEQNTLAVVYRSPFDMTYSGDARVKTRGLPEVGPSHTHVKLNFPQQVTVAYAVRPIEPWKVEADIVWTDWDVVKDLTVSSTNPAFDQVQKADWKSGFTYRAGTQYDLSEHWALRAGYAFGQRAVPGNTFSPLVPDSNYHLVSAGLGYTINNWSIDAAYQFIFREHRHIANSEFSPITDGQWKNIFNAFVVSATLKM